MAARVHTVGPPFLPPRSAPASHLSLRLRECPGAQAEVDGEIVGVGAHSGGQSAGTSGVAALVWANRILKV